MDLVQIFYEFYLICILALLNSRIIVSQEIIGYDCSTQDLNFTSISLNSVSQCPDIDITSESVTEEIQLVEMTDEIEVDVISCQIIVHRTIFYCGMYSHLAAAKGGYMSYPYYIKRDRCMDLYSKGEICLFCGTNQRIILSNVKEGTTVRKEHIFAGGIGGDFSCIGGDYQDEFGSWHQVIVQGYVQISVIKRRAIINTNTDVIHLPNGLVCKASTETCRDDATGEHYWKTLSQDACKKDNHIVLYEGLANVTTAAGRKRDLTKTIVTVNMENILFSLRLHSEHSLCTLSAYKTEHPKLIIIRKTGFGFMFRQKALTSQRMDLFTYVNSKFVFVERNIETNMNNLYKVMAQTRCDLESMSLKINLALGMNNPQEFGYIFGGGPGYTGTQVGEVIYISKCKAVYVQFRRAEKCFHELPVTYLNSSYYLTPKTKLLQKFGTEVTCSTIFPPTFEISGSWYRILKGAIEIKPPKILTPSSIHIWEYRSIKGLATSGIYTQNDLENLRSHIMYGSEREAIETVLTRSTQGLDPDRQGLSTSSLLDDDGLDKIGNKIGEKMWNTFSMIGNISSGIIGIIFVIKLVKMLANVIISGTLLYHIHGWSVAILACFCDSLTSYMIHVGSLSKIKKETTKSGDGSTDFELLAVKTEQPLLCSAPIDPEHSSKTDSVTCSLQPVQKDNVYPVEDLKHVYR